MKKWKARAYRLALAALPNPAREMRVEGEAPEGLKSALRRQHARGAAVALFDRSGLCGLALYGDVGRDTAFRAASVSKHITAMAAWRMHEAGIIDIDADADAFLPCSLRHPQAPGTPVTLRRLLSHTAGIHDGAAYAAGLREGLCILCSFLGLAFGAVLLVLTQRGKKKASISYDITKVL